MLPRRRRAAHFSAAAITFLLTTLPGSTARAESAFAPVCPVRSRVGFGTSLSPWCPSRLAFVPPCDRILWDRASSPISSSLSIARYDNLVSGLAEISFAFAIGVLWSEASVAATGCGPADLGDLLERVCYQGVIVSAGSSVFCRIVTRKGLAAYLEEDYFGEGMLATSSVVQVRVAEVLSLLAVAGAIVALASQISHGERMDGMSGIDRELCGALRDL
jgi:hypothetical protein